jgi:hypothetical protein
VHEHKATGGLDVRWDELTNTHENTRQKLTYENTASGKKIKHTLDRPWGFLEVEAPSFQDIRQTNVVRLLVLRIGHLYFQEMLLVLISVSSLFDLGIMSMKNSSQTREPQACSSVPQPTAPPAAFTPKEIRLVIFPVKDWVEPTAMVRPKGLCQWHHRESNRRPSGLKRSNSTNDATACPRCWQWCEF